MTRVAVVTQADPFYVPLFFEEFFTTLPDEVQVEAVVELDPFDESFLELVSRMFQLYGPANFVRQGVRYVVSRVADAVGYGQYSIASVAADYDVPVLSRDSVNESDFVRYLNQRDIDIVLSVAAPEIFEEPLLIAPNWGCLNVHTSKLPQYRGMLPTFWAMYHDEDNIGVTVHTMTTELDKGEIVAQTTFPVDDRETLDDVMRKGKRQGGRLAANALESVHTGSVTLNPMEGDASYFSFPTVEDRREFQRRGNRLL